MNDGEEEEEYVPLVGVQRVAGRFRLEYAIHRKPSEDGYIEDLDDCYVKKIDIGVLDFEEMSRELFTRIMNRLINYNETVISRTRERITKLRSINQDESTIEILLAFERSVIRRQQHRIRRIRILMQHHLSQEKKDG